MFDSPPSSILPPSFFLSSSFLLPFSFISSSFLPSSFLPSSRTYWTSGGRALSFSWTRRFIQSVSHLPLPVCGTGGVPRWRPREGLRVRGEEERREGERKGEKGREGERREEKGREEPKSHHTSIQCVAWLIFICVHTLRNDYLPYSLIVALYIIYYLPHSLIVALYIIYYFPHSLIVAFWRWDLTPNTHILPLFDVNLFHYFRYRSKGRVPVTVWRHPRTGASISRSAQPLKGLKGITTMLYSSHCLIL